MAQGARYRLPEDNQGELLAHQLQRNRRLAAYRLLHFPASVVYALISHLERNERPKDDSTEASKKYTFQEKTIA